MTPARIAIVVCTYNRSELLRRALDSLLHLETGGRFTYEILVVDNKSTDDTPDAIAEVQARSPVPLRSVRETKEGVACARNRGVAEADGDWIAFFDDDQEAHPRWVLELLTLAEQKNCRVVGGRNLLLLPDEVVRTISQPCRAMLGESIVKPAPCPYDRNWSPGTGNLMLHRSVFEEVGVFNEELREAGEDTDLLGRIFRAGIAAWHSPTAIIYHAAPPYRLDDHYFHWKSLRHGGHLARRDFEARGRVQLLGLAAARLAQAAMLHAPRRIVAGLRRDPLAAQAASCRLWKTEGYARFALHFFSPTLFAQRAFMSRLDFRGERATLATVPSAPSLPVS